MKLNFPITPLGFGDRIIDTTESALPSWGLLRNGLLRTSWCSFSPFFAHAVRTGFRFLRLEECRA